MSRTIIVATAEWLARASSGSLPGEALQGKRSIKGRKNSKRLQKSQVAKIPTKEYK